MSKSSLVKPTSTATLSLKDFRAYQEEALQFILERPCAGLFLDMGLGKTIVTLTAVRELIRAKRAKHFLLVGPIRPIEQVWRQECRLWEHTQKVRIQLVRGSPKQRDAQLREPAHIHMINPENVAWLIEWMKMYGCPFDGLIVDESSMFKNSTTQRWKNLKLALHMFNIRIILTGTPRPNSLSDLWAQVYLLDRGERLGTSFYRFRDRFFESDYMGYTYEPRPGADERVHQLISDIVLRMDAKDHLDIPPLISNVVTVELGAKAMAMYQKFEKEMLLQLSDANVIEALNPAALSMRCHQIANGAIYNMDKWGQRINWDFTVIHDDKLDALQEIIDETGEPVMVAYQFKHDLARLRQRYPAAPFLGGDQEQSTEQIIRECVAGKHPVLLVHPRSASHGINDLEKAFNTIVFFSLTWSLEQHDQLIARIGGARAASHGRPTVVHYIHAKETVDEAILASVETKDRGQRATLDALRSYSQKRRDPLLY